MADQKISQIAISNPGAPALATDEVPVANPARSAVLNFTLSPDDFAVYASKRLIVNVKDYGATGDGVTDDAPAIQAAYNVAAVVNGAVTFPAGTFRLATGIVAQPVFPAVVSPRVDFIGQGPTATVLKGDAGVNCLTLICGSGGMTDIRVDGFGFSGGANGIVVSDLSPYNWGLTHSIFSHLKIFNMTGAGILINAQEILEVTFEHVDVELCDYGGHITCSLCANIVTFQNCQWRECTTCGLYLGENLGSVVLINNLCESNFKTGLQLSGPNVVRLIGGWFENNARNLVGGPYPHVIVGTTFSCNGVAFQNVIFNAGANDGNTCVQVTTTGVVGPLVFDKCMFGVTNKVDVGAWAAKPPVVVLYEGNPTIVGTPASLINYGNADISAPGGVNIGTATGAAAGQIKTSGKVLIAGATFGMLGVLDAAAPNDATRLVATVSGGADGTLGEMQLGFYIHPSATGASRYAEISPADTINWRDLVLCRQGGRVGIGTASPKSELHVVGLPVYANNAAAIAGGLTAGAFYRTGADPDPVCVVH